MTAEPFSRERITYLFEALSQELAVQGQRADLFLVGGAAIALTLDIDRTTRDLDAVFVPTGSVRAAAAAVAQREGLPEAWLNDAVKGFLPGTDQQATRFFETEHLSVDVASPEYLLAMKLLASRTEYDASDIALLYRVVGYTTVAQGLDLVERAYPRRPIEAKVQFLLEEIVAGLGPSTGAAAGSQ